MKKLGTAITFFFIATFSVHADDAHHYLQGLNKMSELGIIDAKQYKKQMVDLKTDMKNSDNFKEQTRGVASKLKKLKIYQIENDAIEIPSN